MPTVRLHLKLISTLYTLYTFTFQDRVSLSDYLGVRKMRGTHVSYIPNPYTGNIYRNMIHENIFKNSSISFKWVIGSQKSIELL